MEIKLEIRPILIIAFLTLAVTILSSDVAEIVSLVMIMGVISGIILNTNMESSLVNTFISTLLGSVVSFIISTITVYYSLGGMYAIETIQASLIYILIYIIVGTIGGAIGYYFAGEINERLYLRNYE